MREFLIEAVCLERLCRERFSEHGFRAECRRPNAPASFTG
jgi:hypothetical protein